MKKSHLIAALLGVLFTSANTIAIAEEQVYVKSLYFSHVTADADYARTHDDVTFSVITPKVTIEELCPNYPYDERERAKRDTYCFDVAKHQLSEADVRAASLRVSTAGKNAWLPSRFQVWGVLSNGQRVDFLDQKWKCKWFSTEEEYITVKEWVRVDHVDFPSGKRTLGHKSVSRDEPLLARAEWDLREP